MITIEINDKLCKDIEKFCSLNNISDIQKFCLRMLNQGFLIEKHGVSPFMRMPISSDNTPKKDEKETEITEIEEIKKPVTKKVRIIKK